MARILVIDDEVLYCENLQFALSETGHDVATAAALNEAVAVARSFHPDLVICDWLFGDGMTGQHVLMSLRQLPLGFSCILITGAIDELTAEVGTSEFEEVLRKPFTTEELLLVVDRMVDDRPGDGLEHGNEY